MTAIGTMSIFIATEAFEGGALEAIKLAVLLASMLSASIGMLVLWRAGGMPDVSPGSRRQV